MFSSYSCTHDEFKTFCNTAGVFAIIDVREQEEFSRQHILMSSNVPLSRFEFIAPVLIQNKNIPVIVVDSGLSDDLRAQKAIDLLLKMDYEDPARLEGGLAAWLAAGNIAVQGTSCLAKGYAELLEMHRQTPGLTPDEVQQLLASGEKIVFVDIREFSEHTVMAIPGSVLAPGCEVAYRLLDLAPEPETRVVVNCGARTRGILCSQMLNDFGVPNKVAYLKGGTQNWQLHGYPLEFGAKRITAPPSQKALNFACARAAEMAQKQQISFVDADTVRQWQAEAENKPLYIFDVRQQEEYEAGHLPGSRHISGGGGQLVQRSDDYTAIRNARFVLVDDTEARAVITAYWLKQVAIPHVFVLKGGIGGSGLGRDGLAYGPEPKPEISCMFDLDITNDALLKAVKRQQAPLVINVGYSDRHRQGHVPGAVWVPRSRLERVRATYPRPQQVVITADCILHARLTAVDAQELWPEADIRYLREGTLGWQRAGLPLEEGMPVAFSEEDDVWYLIYKDPTASSEAIEAFFDWKHELAAQIQADRTYHFHLPA